jgi:hypothetical protein
MRREAHVDAELSARFHIRSRGSRKSSKFQEIAAAPAAMRSCDAPQELLATNGIPCL